MTLFELTIEDGGDGICTINATNHDMPTTALIGVLEVELHSLKEQAYHRTKFNRTIIKPNGTIIKVEDKKEGK